MMLRVAINLLLGLGSLALLFYVAQTLLAAHESFSIAVLAGAGAMLGMVFFRRAGRRLFSKRRILVLGTGTRAAKVSALLKGIGNNRRLQVAGFLPLQGVHHYVDHSLILPDKESIAVIADRYNIDEIVIAVRERRGGGLPVDDLLECKLKGIRVIELCDFFEKEKGQVQLESLNSSWIVLAEGFRQNFVRDTVKHVFDLVTSAMLLVITLPLILLTLVCIALDSGFPVFYRQERVGQGGRVFVILKFRSMRQGAECDGEPKWAGRDDQRVTRVGRLIRRLRIDELPQIFNVLKGEMSFVGPRPERPFFVNQLIQQIPYYSSRHSIKPGITGWAQVRYPYGASLEDAIEKFQYDLYYLKNHTFFLDMMILFQTARVVLLGRGAR